MRSPTLLLREIRHRQSETTDTPTEQPPEETTVSRLLRTRGWAVVYSRLLDEQVVFLTDVSVTPPPGAAVLVSYTRAELELLSTATADALREIHRAKKAFPGSCLTALNALGNGTIEKLTA